MSWLLSLVVALLAGAIALACMLLITSGFVDWYQVSSREGASGYFVIFFSLLAGIIGAVIGLIVARKVGPGFASQMLWAGGINVLLCALIAGIGYLFAPHRPKLAGDEPKPDLMSAQEDYEAAQKARVQAEFDAVPHDAPMTAWFPYTGDGGKAEHRAAALLHIQAKPGHIAELSALMVSTDRRTAVEALQIVRQLPKPPAPELKAGVVACGRHLASLIRQVNETPEADDPHYERAGEASVRFSAWIATVGILREPESGGTADDFIPELREILTLSRARPEIHAMRQDVLRVASYYAEKWAGIAPLPGDPPPK